MITNGPLMLTAFAADGKKMYWREYERIGARHVIGGIALTI